MATEWPAVMYLQGGRTVYVAIPKIAELLQYVPPRDNPNVISDTNRRLFPAHAKAFGSYVWDVEDWISGAVMVAVQEASFAPARAGQSYGRITLPDDDNAHLFDGQHRLSGLREKLGQELGAIGTLRGVGTEEAIEEADAKQAKFDEVAASTIPVIIEVEANIDVLRQRYADISHVRVPDPITTTRFDKRDPFNAAAFELSETHPLLKDRVEMERNFLTAKSNALMTLNQLATVLQVLYYGIGKRPRTVSSYGMDAGEIANRGRDFFDDVSSSLESLHNIEAGATTPIDVRERGDLSANVTILRVLAAIWREVVVIKEEPRTGVVEFISTMPTTAGPGTIWQVSGMVPTPSSSPMGRAQELRSAVNLGIEAYEQAA